jgi:hypothetical protein
MQSNFTKEEDKLLRWPTKRIQQHFGEGLHQAKLTTVCCMVWHNYRVEMEEEKIAVRIRGGGNGLWIIQATEEDQHLCVIVHT